MQHSALKNQKNQIKKPKCIPNFIKEPGANLLRYNLSGLINPHKSVGLLPNSSREEPNFTCKSTESH